ncbi:MAG: hypothetical protein JST39_16825 [Bacteroidetes bacterium]|nr:hypothetical protein [Bacteroidota bacterium]
MSLNNNPIRRVVPLAILCVLSFLHMACAQTKVCFVKYAAIPDEANHKWQYLAVDTTHIMMFDYRNPDEAKIVTSYRLSSEKTTLMARVKDGSFDNEPREIRGHRLVGAYLNKQTGMYELIYLLPGKASMFTKYFYGPGKLFTYNYASDKKINPFEDLFFPTTANDTIQLRPIQHKRKNNK